MACGGAEPTAVAGGKDYLRSAASLVGQPQQSPTANSETFTSPPVVGWEEAEVNVVNQKSLADHNFAPFSHRSGRSCLLPLIEALHHPDERGKACTSGDRQQGNSPHMLASEAQIAEVERHFAVRFPDDYRHFLLTRGTMGEFLPPANAYVTIYPVEEIIPVNEAGLIQDRFPRAVVIGGDGSREMLTYDFRHDEPSLVLLDITAENWPAAIHQASSLTDLLAQLPQRGWLFQ